VIDSDTVIGKGATVGVGIEASKGITLVGGGLNVPENVAIPDAVICGKDMLAELSANKGVM
jgi:hypothetical protein